jgi:ABC-type Fe3+ transport system substrate-binding protein
MRADCLRGLVSLLSLTLVFGLPFSSAHSVSSQVLMKAKKEAEAKGYIFALNHDEIVAKAKKEGRLRVLSRLDPAELKPMVEGFKNEYPFIDVRAEEIAGVDTFQRMILEMKSGAAKGWDVNFMAPDFYNDYLPYQKKFDVHGMVQHGVLNLPIEMVDPINRNVVAFLSISQVVAYNKNLISEDKVPSVWEDFLKPEFKGKKILVDIRPQEVANLVPAWGLEKTLKFSKSLAQQSPIWVRGHTRVLAAMVAGEYPMLLGANLNSTLRVMKKDRASVIAYKAVEPIPVRIHGHEGVFEKADSPYAGLLWLEFMGSSKAQKIVETASHGSLFVPGTIAHQLTQGKTVSLAAWDDVPKLREYQEKVFEAFGFPKADVGK